jgi:tetratricopeptide (TPR) repeat protein
MLLKNVGKLIIFNGFLVMNCSHTETVPYRSNEHVAVVFEVVNVCTSYVCSIDSNRVIFDLGTTFQLDLFDFDDNLQLWIARLFITNNSTQIAQNYIITQQQTMEKMTLAIIMGELLLIINDLSKTRIYFENLQNEDDALIYYYYGHIHYVKGEYDLALENFQISYELMISGERLKDSAFVLHNIGYVYDMKKEFNEAYDNHRKALEIRQIYYPENDVYIGISFYNIGRTLVNMGDDDQALIYHKKALNIWEQTLTNDHPYIIRSLHSHGVTYFNKRDYTQASHYYTRALELYETTTPRDEHGILMIRNALENIKDLSSRQLMTQ